MTPTEGAAALDEILRAAGYERTDSMGRVRWQGLHHGRAAQITLSPQSRTRYAGEVRYRQRLGLRLRIELAASIEAAIFFVTEGFVESKFVRFVYRLRRQTVLEDVPAALAGFRVVTKDVGEARRLLASTPAVDAIAWMLRVQTDPTGEGLQGSVHAGEGRLYYASPVVGAEVLDHAYLRGVLDSLAWVAHEADRSGTGSPTVP